MHFSTWFISGLSFIDDKLSQTTEYETASQMVKSYNYYNLDDVVKCVNSIDNGSLNYQMIISVKS